MEGKIQAEIAGLVLDKMARTQQDTSVRDKYKEQIIIVGKKLP